MKWTVTQAAEELGIHPDTMRARMRATGFDPKPRDLFTTLQIVDAFVGTLEKEKIRLTGADADLKELERSEKKGELVPFQSAKQTVRAILSPLRARLMALPAILASRCNPEKPEMARAVMMEEIKRCLRDVSNEDEFTP